MKIFFDTIGCRLNQAEIERWAAQFVAAGHELTDDPGQADLAIINTCAVTANASSDSRGKVRNAAKAGAKVIVSGCWSTLEPLEAARMEGVLQVVPNEEKDDLPAGILGTIPDAEARRVMIPGIHARTRAFIKVQDGCDNHCTFCATRLARGRSRSIPADRILQDVLAALRTDVKEIVLTGVNLGAWGLDFSPAKELADLTEFLLRETDVPRIRLSSLESWNLTDRFLYLWEDPRMCPHFHIPLQSGSESVLKRMARRTTLPDFRHLVETAQSIDPDFAITSDVIAGFQGETEAEHQETLDFIRSLRFAGGHVFPFSIRPGTPAEKMPGTVDSETKKRRAKEIRDEFDRQGRIFRERFVGTEQTVLWESAHPLPDGSWECRGLTGNYLTVTKKSPLPVSNELESVKLVSEAGGVLIAESINN